MKLTIKKLQAEILRLKLNLLDVEKECDELKKERESLQFTIRSLRDKK